MLTRADLEEIADRYQDSEMDAWPRDQAVFDIGRLLGHAADLARQIADHQAALAGLGRQWNDQRDARLVVEDRVAALGERVAALEAAITRALAGCPFCRAGNCRAEAHEWLRAALHPPPAEGGE
jgi:hypothetical protein